MCLVLRRNRIALLYYISMSNFNYRIFETLDLQGPISVCLYFNVPEIERDIFYHVSKAPYKYAVQGSDTTMFNQGANVR